LGSYYWIVSTRTDMLAGLKSDPELHRKMATVKQPEPLSEAGKKLVTSHGDFHLKNAAKSANGRVWALDLDMAAVQYAIGDISYHFYISDIFLPNAYYFNYGKETLKENYDLMWDGKYHKLTRKSRRNQRKFARAYLKQLDMSHKKKDIDLLLYDSMCGFAYHNFNSILVVEGSKNNFELINQLIAFQRRANESKKLQKLVRESNIYLAMLKDQQDNKK